MRVKFSSLYSIQWKLVESFPVTFQPLHRINQLFILTHSILTTTTTTRYFVIKTTKGNDIYCSCVIQALHSKHVTGQSQDVSEFKFLFAYMLIWKRLRENSIIIFINQMLYILKDSKAFQRLKCYTSNFFLNFCDIILKDEVIVSNLLESPNNIDQNYKQFNVSWNYLIWN